ncbi:MAG: penicillin-binding protein 1A [Candidatus Aminicenantaceae bacterium]
MLFKKNLIIRIKKPQWKKGFYRFLVIILFLSVFTLGALLGTYKAIKNNLPDIEKLRKYKPYRITYIYADNEEDVIGEYALRKRIEVSYEEIPDDMKNAIIATEDPRFFRHKGIDILGILRALREDIRLKRRTKSLQGGSTITQQLVREILLHPKQTLRRKIKEALLALQLERDYTKEEILTWYCNQFNLGHGTYGVESASRLFFGKMTSELNLEEIALITGIFRGPGIYSPYRRPELTLRRRNHVLNRMYEAGFISKEKRDEIKEKSLDVLPLHRGESEFAGYFREEVRRYLIKNYGYDSLYKEGLKVYLTMDMRLQKYAEDALKKQLRILDKRQGWRDDKKNLLEEGNEDLEEVWLDDWVVSSVKRPIEEAIVLDVSRQNALVKVKDYTGKLTNSDIEWTEIRNLRNLIKRGDVIKVKINQIDEEKKELLVSLDQEPLLEGAFLAVEPQTGQIKAMVGGYSYKRSEYNRATQATRQPGSAIKPILYTAALENGFTNATIIIDEPTEFTDKWSDEPWSPPNYDEKYKGAVTFRMGLEQSRNVVSAKILESISPQTGVEYCHKFGLSTIVYPYLSLSLGTFEVYMKELMSAYTVFPNKGIRIEPYFITRIEDKDGNILEERKVESERVISQEIAYMITSLMQGVIQRGSGTPARPLTEDKDLAGKTGTTDNFTDAWFIGFSPSLCAGVWIGHDLQTNSIGDRQSGMVAAQPVWIEFFKKVIEDEEKKAEDKEVEFEKEEFDAPTSLNLVFKEIDRKTGLLATPVCLYPFKEVFLPGTEPTKFCSYEDHMRILDYYSTKKEKNQ